MKKRMGFVSNSSSSSFVLILDAMPENPKHLMALLKINNLKIAKDLYASVDWKESYIHRHSPAFDSILSNIMNKDKALKKWEKDAGIMVSVYARAWMLGDKDEPKFCKRFKAPKELFDKTKHIFNFDLGNCAMDNKKHWYLEKESFYENVPHIVDLRSDR